MTEVAIYLFAPKTVGHWRNRKHVRALKIEEATYSANGHSYTPGRLLVDTEIPCDEHTPDECLIIRGQITNKV